MKLGYHIRYLKTTVTLVAAVLYWVLAPAWCAPGVGLHRAALALGAYGSNEVVRGSLWSSIVKLIGWHAGAIGFVSIAFGSVCVALLAKFASDLIYSAIVYTKLKKSQSSARYSGIRSYAVVIFIAAFVLTPGLLLAATRVGPLMTALALLLGGFVILAHIIIFPGRGLVGELMAKRYRVFAALILLAAGAWEFLAMGRGVRLQTLIPLIWFGVLGLLPLMALRTLVRYGRLVHSRHLLCFLGIWVFFISLSGLQSYFSFARGQAANRIVKGIVADAEGCEAIVAEDALYDMILFMRPREQRVISLEWSRDARLRAELVKWIKGAKLQNLVWAAEIGPRTLVDEWMRLDRAECLKRVRSSAYYFPTVERWREACAHLKGINRMEPLGDYMRWLVSACGNHLACQALEDGRKEEAWKIFWTILNEIDVRNCTTIANLYGMVSRGYPHTTAEKDLLDKLNAAAVKHYASPRRLFLAAMSGGRLYLDPQQVSQHREEGFESASRRLTEREKEFVKTVAAAPNGALSAERAREAIRKGVSEGLVRLLRIGPQLLRLDIVLNDWKAAEKDAGLILASDYRDPDANGVMGLALYLRGEYGEAERHLRLAVSTGHANAAAFNDLAMVLLKTNRAAEAEEFAIKAVKARPNDWNFCETLALALIRAEKPEEGESVLSRAVELAKGAGVEEEKIIRFAIDRAWLKLAKGDKKGAREAMREISRRPDATNAIISELRLIEKLSR